MTTNQTIDGVPRELIEKAMLACFEAGFGIPHAELRALLDAESAPCAKSQVEPATQPQPDPLLCKFYDVSDYHGLVRELVGHVALLQDSAKRNVKPWEDTFPPTLLPAYIKRVNAENAAAQPQGEPVAWMDPRSPEMHATISNEVKQHNLKFGGAPAAAVNGYSIPLYAEQPAPVAVAMDERQEFVAWVRREWSQAPLSNVRDLLPKDDPRYGEYCDESLRRAWVGWQARATANTKSQ
ncbi:hypothetical protein [Pseudomonas sp. O11]|uniref:hypothetical protein n=1 Tax=Pseudomonas sp. O11 TaxID=3159446 RepID=UPI00387B7599